jgi:protein-disulfide isomerase
VAVTQFLNKLTLVLVVVAIGTAWYAISRRRDPVTTGYLPVTYIEDDTSGIARLDPQAFDRITQTQSGRLGARDAPVSIVVYSDYSCGACAVYDSILSEVHGRLPDHVQIIVKNFLPSINRINLQPHLAAYCADLQGHFAEYHHNIFRHSTVFNTRDGWRTLADSAGITDVDAFASCTRSRRGERQIRQDSQEGQALGVRVTPTSLVNGVLVVGAISVDQLVKVLAPELGRLR